MAPESEVDDFNVEVPSQQKSRDKNILSGNGENSVQVVEDNYYIEDDFDDAGDSNSQRFLQQSRDSKL